MRCNDARGNSGNTHNRGRQTNPANSGGCNTHFGISADTGISVHPILLFPPPRAVILRSEATKDLAVAVAFVCSIRNPQFYPP